MSKKGFFFLIGVYVILVPLPFWLGEYYTHVLNMCFYYVIMAASWNLIAGYTGQFSLAHHAFAAMGGYTSALLVIHYQIPILLGIPCGGILAGAFGYFLGTLCLRMRAIYLGLSTWAFSESFRITLSMAYKLTRGDLGLSTPRLLKTAQAFPYYYIFLVLALVFVLVSVLLRSRPWWASSPIRKTWPRCLIPRTWPKCWAARTRDGRLIPRR